MTKRHELRKATVAATRGRKKALADANKAIDKITKKYWDDLDEGVNAIFQACVDAGFEYTGTERRIIPSGRIVYPFSLEGDDKYGLAVSTYQMQSGRWELTAYVS